MHEIARGNSEDTSSIYPETDCFDIGSDSPSLFALSRDEISAMKPLPA
jgi:hypothetical protein